MVEYLDIYKTYHFAFSTEEIFFKVFYFNSETNASELLKNDFLATTCEVMSIEGLSIDYTIYCVIHIERYNPNKCIFFVYTDYKLIICIACTNQHINIQSTS